MKSRSQKALFNTVVLGVYQLVYFICGLILPRFLLLHFGSDYNGVVSSITQFLNFISILQLGIAGATRFALYKVLANDDKKGISGIVNATERYMRGVGCVLLLYIGTLVFVYPYIASTNIPPFESGLLVLIIGASTFSQYFFGITYQILLTADQRQYIYYLIATVATVFNTIIAVVLMKSGQSIFVVKLGSAIVFVFVPIILYSYVRKKYEIDKKVAPDKAGVKGRWDVMWHSVANILHNNTSLAVLTILADTKLVSVYTVYYLVINGLQKILSVFTSSLEAGFGNMFAKKEIKTAYKNLEFYEFFMCSFVSVVFSCALVLIVPFVEIYTKGVNDVNYYEPTFASIAVVAQMIMCIRQPYLTVVQASGHYKQTRNGAFLEACLNIVVSIIATLIWGIVGVAIGILVANSVRTLQYMLYLKNNILERPIKKPIGMVLWTAVNVLTIYLSSNFVIKYFTIESWFEWLVFGTICFVIAVSVTGTSAFVFCRQNLFMTKMLFKKFITRRTKKV